MKYSYNWLKDYYKADMSAEQTGEDLVLLGSDVEEVSSFPPIDEKIIAVKITKITPHPNADKLRLATIAGGEKETTVVCGAPNIEVGQICCFAQVGAKVRDFEIEEAEIRGVKSPGMLLSPRELEISEDHRGIYILPEDTELGARVGEILGKDQVFDLEITPNRGDLLSHFGLARDLAAKYGQRLEKPVLQNSHAEPGSASKILKQVQDDKKVQAQDDIKVTIESPKCSLYLAKVIEKVKIAPSPKWLQDKLIAVGAKPINNIVDVTNYIMLDLGHPLHAFDKSKISDNAIVVKEFSADTDVVTLDGEARTVLPQMLGIWDGERPVAIAGIMGLKNSEVDENTTDIVLEAAVFERKSVRKTAKLLNLKTEASARFERGVDSEGAKYAIDKAAKLIQEIAGGEIRPVVMAENKSVIPDSIRNLKIPYDKINSYANLNLEKKEIDEILENLGFQVESGEAAVPSWRHDIEIWQDLAEEVYRINGLDKIVPLPLREMQKSEPSDYFKKEKIKDYLVELGLDEAISYTFLSDEDVVAAKLDSSDLLEVVNPVQDEIRYLRTSLIPGLLRAISKNPSFDDIEFFELGNIFSKENEWTSLGIATSGKSARKAEEIVDLLCKKFSFNIDAFKIYEINKEELKRFKVKKPAVFIVEAKMTDLFKSAQFDDLSLTISGKKVEYRPISKFPPVKRDLAFVVDEEIPSAEFGATILQVAPEAVLVELFDEFSSDKLGTGKKSLAYHVYLQKLEKTLENSEADEVVLKIVEEIKEKFGAELRG